MMAMTAAAVLSACADGTIEQNTWDSQQGQIIGGELPDEPMHAAVVSLHQRADDSWSTSIFCSGTLIAERVVLTAAHCLDMGTRRTVVPVPPEKLAIYVGDNPTTDPNPVAYFVSEALIHPLYDKIQIRNDIALIRLVQAPGVTPVPALPQSLGLTSSDEGATINFAGFGQDEYNHYDQKLQVDGILEEIYTDQQIYYAQLDGGPCFGDSGGPAFIKRGQVPYVAGITSYGDATCSQYGVSTRPDAFQGWIDEFVGGSNEPICTADGWCNPECAPDADVDCGTQEPSCGNGVCDGFGEDCDSCPADCGEIIHIRHGRVACCGNGICERRERNACSIDCN